MKMPQQSIIMIIVVVAFAFACVLCYDGTATAFVLLPSLSSHTPPRVSLRTLPVVSQQQQQQQQQEDPNLEENKTTGQQRRSSKPSRRRRNNEITLADLSKELLQNPSALAVVLDKNNKKNNGNNNNNQKKKRTRRRTENPQQQYVYAAQRRQTTNKKNNFQADNNNDANNGENSSSSTSSTATMQPFANRRGHYLVAEARRMGLTNPASQHCDPLVDLQKEPEIVGQIRVGEEETGSGALAYIIHKPQGWSILGGSGGGSGNSGSSGPSENAAGTSDKKKKPTSSSSIKRVKIKDAQGKDEILEFDEAEVLALLSPEERAEIEASGGSIFHPTGTTILDDSDNFRNNIPGWNDINNMTPEEREEAGIEDEDYDPNDVPDFDEADILALLSPEELAEYNQEKMTQNGGQKQQPSASANHQPAHVRYENMSEDELDPEVVENLRRIKARLSQKSDTASFASNPRPSIVSWLKEKKTEEGSPIRGGNFWTALAGASEVDDTGLVLLVPKENAKNVFVDFTEYVAVVGNGNNIDPKAAKAAGKEIPKDAMTVDLISKLKRNREGDIAHAIRVVVSEHASTCSSIIRHVQSQFDDGIRGDPAANPFDRRAPRRLIHCNSIAASSLLFDETAQVESELPDDIAVLSDRLNNHKFRKGSFLGRKALQENPLTNAYREINGAADGYPGWTVDRYADWLLVQHDEKEYRGPLPSIHDGYTAGVYLLPSNPNRGAMGSKDNIRPYLLEGRPAPETVEILENGIKYHINLDRDLSTGIFLDQRTQRAWLAQNCNTDTHVLNCFAHCGAFTVAAASAGASTVSLDLNKKWLDRIQPQLEANGLVFDERHDCIYGDCFDWLEKLAARGEKFDIVILDPPSSSVGKKKRRWSVKNDMEELVQLAAPLVKKGGLLWTTTNSASISPLKFANQCRNGLENAGIKSVKLERIQPMPVDFPSIGYQPVKNVVWRLN
jgi:23S rRNA (cytosine1962-C5)-methyltransferase